MLKCAGHGWPSVPVAMDGEKGPLAMTRTGRSRLERRPRMAKCPCSQGWREGTIAMDG
ncbi:MAG TPA: hypothetical protein VMW91_08640 [Desulfosporosinus sp.]|nr:hypothetical protein [Desulfosporosinus sp.]